MAVPPTVFWPGLTNLVFPPPPELNYPELLISHPADRGEAQMLPRISFSTPGPTWVLRGCCAHRILMQPCLGQARMARDVGRRSKEAVGMNQGTWQAQAGNTGRSCHMGKKQEGCGARVTEARPPPSSPPHKLPNTTLTLIPSPPGPQL